ncbi:MAG: hypothetical protein HY718_01025 [Planctomycetes bacterium]|nr:hypothetical protein [Planctomycetota bacterium]
MSRGLSRWPCRHARLSDSLPARRIEEGRGPTHALSGQECLLLQLFRELPDDEKRTAVVEALGLFTASYRSPAHEGDSPADRYQGRRGKDRIRPYTRPVWPPGLRLAPSPVGGEAHARAVLDSLVQSIGTGRGNGVDGHTSSHEPPPSPPTA